MERLNDNQFDHSLIVRAWYVCRYGGYLKHEVMDGPYDDPRDIAYNRYQLPGHRVAIHYHGPMIRCENCYTKTAHLLNGTLPTGWEWITTNVYRCPKHPCPVMCQQDNHNHPEQG